MISGANSGLEFKRPTSDRVAHFWKAFAVLGGVFLLAFLIAPFFCQASEDAIILFQYSANLAHTGVISYIPHGPRAEGATDFLWMVYLAAGRFLGIPSYGLAVASSALCVVLLAFLLVRLAGQKVNVWNVAAIVFLVLLVPQTFAAEAGFSVFAFALFLGLMAAVAFHEKYGHAVLAGFLLCLVRPDGVVFALPLLIVYLFRGGEFRSRVWKFASGFALPGIIYFLWRWHYFGLLLPLPFYVKSDTPRVFGVLVVRSAVSLIPPLVAACALLWIALRKTWFAQRNLLLFGTLVLPSSLFYLAMRLDQNYANRFFLYPLIVAAVLLAANYDSFRDRNGAVLLGGAGIWVLFLAYFWVNWFVIYTLEYSEPQVVAVSRELEQLPGGGTMIVSESGAIPFYSQWTAYDPWGLNTPQFAKHLIQPADVVALHPDLVIVHQEAGALPCTVTAGTTPPYTARSWPNMTQNVIAGVDRDEYVQWLLPEYNDYYRSHPTRWNLEPRWGKYDYQCWFIRSHYSESAKVADILRRNGGISVEEYLKANSGQLDNHGRRAD